MRAESTESPVQPIENSQLPSSNTITNPASDSPSSLTPAVPAPVVPAPFLSTTASFPDFDETMALPAYPPLLIGDGSESGSMPMEFWNALVNSLPVPANGKSRWGPFSTVNDVLYLLDPFAALTSNDQLEFGSDMLVDHPFEVAAIEGPGLAVPSIVPLPNLSHHAQALSSILDSLLDATLLGQRPEATDTDVLSNREPAVNDSSNHLGQGPKRKCANDSTSKKQST